MEKGYAVQWQRLGRLLQAFLIVTAVYIVLYFSRLAPLLQWFVGLAAFVLGISVLVRFARRGMREAIWRLRNRLIAAYLFIAVVPIVLILTLTYIACRGVIGQMAVYLVNTELQHRGFNLQRQAEILARVPIHDPDAALSRFAMMTRNQFPDAQLLITGEQELRYPAGSQISPPPPVWAHTSDQRTHDLIVKREGQQETLYVWAFVTHNSMSVTILAPVTHEWLASLQPNLGDINFVPLMGHIRTSHVPPAANVFDFKVSGFYLESVPLWESPQITRSEYLVVDTRLSAVLGIIFGQKINVFGQPMYWSEVAMVAFLTVAIAFLVLEVVSLIAGVQLSRSITGAVHELYEGTQRIKEGDFSYRIPVKGSDQLAELGNSFNSMTANLGRLIVVAKEKERLESELAIAREVQDQLFPKDVPYVKTLELKGVCNPARMVSGDYYDFMKLPNDSLAFAIGDVAGKGISAALLMATIQSTMRTQLSGANGHAPDHYSTATLVSNLNRQLYANTAPEKYATFYFALYEEATSALTYTNAGHLAPMLLREGTVTEFESTGTVVGAFPIARYEERTIRLRPGDLLVAYTDGIVEPENAYGEMFGEERLKDLLIKYAHADSSEIIARTMESVRQWTGSSELQDDMTMIAARRL